MAITRTIRQALAKKIKKSEQIYKETAFLNKLAVETSNSVKKRAQLGKSAEKSGSSKKFSPLKPSTKKIRKRYRSELSKNTTPSRSNLTYSGQMHDSYTGRWVSSAKELEIYVNKESRKGESITNSELIRIHEKGNSNLAKRRFFDLTKFEINNLKRKIRDKIRELLAN